jgi:hypothetical protein
VALIWEWPLFGLWREFSTPVKQEQWSAPMTMTYPLTSYALLLLSGLLLLPVVVASRKRGLKSYALTAALFLNGVFLAYEVSVSFLWPAQVSERLDIVAIDLILGMINVMIGTGLFFSRTDLALSVKPHRFEKIFGVALALIAFNALGSSLYMFDTGAKTHVVAKASPPRDDGASGQRP